MKLTEYRMLINGVIHDIKIHEQNLLKALNFAEKYYKLNDNEIDIDLILNIKQNISLDLFIYALTHFSYNLNRKDIWNMLNCEFLDGEISIKLGYSNDNDIYVYLANLRINTLDKPIFGHFYDKFGEDIKPILTTLIKMGKLLNEKT